MSFKVCSEDFSLKNTEKFQINILYYLKNVIPDHFGTSNICKHIMYCLCSYLFTIHYVLCT